MKQVVSISILILTLLLPVSSSFSQQTKEEDALSELEQALSVKINTAARYEQTAAEAPSSVSILTAEDIKRFGYETLSDALGSISGFYISYDRNYSFIGVRGFSRPSDFNNRIRILVNGHTICESMDGTTFAGSELAMTMDAVERIEIVRGPGSALYGTGAMLAVINIVTKDSRTLDGLEVSTSSGSFGSRDISAVFSKDPSSTSHLTLTGRVADSDGRKSLYFREFDLATSNHGIAERLDWEKRHAFTADLQLGKWKVNALYSSREKAIPTASYETTFNDERSRSQDRYGFVEALYQTPLAATLQMTLRAYFDKYVYRGWWPYEQEMAYDRMQGEIIGTEAQLIFDVASNQRILGVAEFQGQVKSQYEYWGDISGLYTDINEPYNVVSLTVQDEYRPSRELSLFAGLRYDSYQRQGSYTAPRLGIVYAPTNRTSVKAMYGQAFRVPTNMERFYEDPNAGWKPNLNLDAENIVTRELALEHQLSRDFQLSSSVYSYRISKLLDPVTDPTDSLIQLRNIGSADAYGVELGLRALLSHGFSAFANYTYERTSGSDVDGQLSNSPLNMVKFGVWSSFLRHFSGSAQMNYQSRRKTVNGTETGAFLLTDLQLQLEPKSSHPSAFGSMLNRTLLSFRVRNLFDQSYSHPGGFEHAEDAIPQDGRTYQLKLSFRM